MVKFDQSMIVIAGDFNLPGWDWKENRAIHEKCHYPNLHYQFVDIINSHGLVQLVDEPTRGENILDLILISNPTRVKNISVVPGVADHDAVQLELDISPDRQKQKRRKISIYSRADWLGLEAHLKRIVAKVEDNGRHIEDQWKLFASDLEEGILKHIPHKLSANKN